MKKSLYFAAVLFAALNARLAVADTIDIFDISVSGFIDMCGVCNGPLQGTLTIDVTKGIVLAADISAFDDELIQVIFSSPSGAGWELAVADEVPIIINDRTLDFTFSTSHPGSLVGFTGGTVTNGLLVDFFEGVVLEDGIQGTITFQSTVVPEPSSLVLVLTGLGLLVGKTRKYWLRS